MSTGFGYGTDELLDMNVSVSVTDLIPGVIIDAKWFDADDIQNDVMGDIEFGFTVKY